jgi:hypothetical protein
MSAIIGVSAVAMASVLLFPNGTTAYLMSMSRDGLLPASQECTQNTKRHHMQQLLPV